MMERLVDLSKPIEVRIFGRKHPAFSGLSDCVVIPDLWMDAGVNAPAPSGGDKKRRHANKKGSEDNMKLAFQGSRSLKKREEEVLEIVKREIEKYNPKVVITSGEPDGVCRLVQLYCRRNGITLKLYHLNRKKYARGAFHNRSKAIIEEADHVIIIHDGESKGTKNELDMAKKLFKPYTYHLIKIPKENIDIDIEQFDTEGISSAMFAFTELYKKLTSVTENCKKVTIKIK